MRGGIFVSYRRDDAAASAGRLYDQLLLHFSRDQIFLDVDTVEPGLDFVKVLDDNVARCEVLLAVIGRGWTTAQADGENRLSQAADYVRIELEAALRRDIRVIPVLVDGARMPTERELPDALKPLARRQGMEISHASFAADTQQLIAVLRRLVQPQQPGPPAAEPARHPSQPNGSADIAPGTGPQNAPSVGALIAAFAPFPIVVALTLFFMSADLRPLAPFGLSDSRISGLGISLAIAAVLIFLCFARTQWWREPSRFLLFYGGAWCLVGLAMLVIFVANVRWTEGWSLLTLLAAAVNLAATAAVMAGLFTTGRYGAGVSALYSAPALVIVYFINWGSLVALLFYISCITVVGAFLLKAGSQR